MKKFWFFDLDGTLADTDADIRGAWKAAIADLGLECPRFDEQFVAGPPIDEMAKKLFPAIFGDDLVKAIRAGFARHYDGDGFPETEEYPGVLDRVRAIKDAGATVMIATNKRYAGAVMMAGHFGWDGVFDAIYAGDMYMDDPSIGKMAKGALLSYVMKNRSIDPGDAVMVGDTENDFSAARENGILSIGVRWGYGTGGESPDIWISDPAELERLARDV